MPFKPLLLALVPPPTFSNFGALKPLKAEGFQTFRHSSFVKEAVKKHEAAVTY